MDAARFGERPLLPALIFWGCVLLLVGLLVIRYARQHAGLWHWLRRWRWGRWVLRIASRLWRDVGGWATLVATRTRRRLERRPRRPPGTNQPGGPDAQMRALYAQLIREGQARGIVHHPADTPFEYGNALGDAVPPAQSEVNALTSAYVQAAYGPAAPTDADVSAGKRLWRRVRQALGRAVS